MQEERSNHRTDPASVRMHPVVRRDRRSRHRCRGVRFHRSQPTGHRVVDSQIRISTPGRGCRPVMRSYISKRLPHLSGHAATHAGDGLGVQTPRRRRFDPRRDPRRTCSCLTVCDIARLPKRGVDTLQVVVTIFLGNVARILRNPLPLGNPNTAIVTQRFGHQRRLDCWSPCGCRSVNLGEAGAPEVCALRYARQIAVALCSWRSSEEDVSSRRLPVEQPQCGFQAAGGLRAQRDTVSAAVRNDEFDHCGGSARQRYRQQSVARVR